MVVVTFTHVLLDSLPIMQPPTPHQQHVVEKAISQQQKAMAPQSDIQPQQSTFDLSDDFLGLSTTSGNRSGVTPAQSENSIVEPVSNSNKEEEVVHIVSSSQFVRFKDSLYVTS